MCSTLSNIVSRGSPDLRNADTQRLELNMTDDHDHMSLHLAPPCLKVSILSSMTDPHAAVHCRIPSSPQLCVGGRREVAWSVPHRAAWSEFVRQTRTRNQVQHACMHHRRRWCPPRCCIIRRHRPHPGWRSFRELAVSQPNVSPLRSGPATHSAPGRPAHAARRSDVRSVRSNDLSPLDAGPPPPTPLPSS